MAFSSQVRVKSYFHLDQIYRTTSGYYEWKTEGKNKRPFYFTLNDNALFCFAGIWDTWTDPNGVTTETFCLLTTEPNPLCATVHDRMPVILRHEPEWSAWLDPQAKPDTLMEMLRPIPDTGMRAHEVSKAVNKAAIDTTEMIVPLPKELF